MREIKFRAWDKNKKCFIPKQVWAVIHTDFNAFGVMIEDWEDYRVGEYFYEHAQELSQYTGLKDKNGVEIYEGDVVEETKVTYDLDKPDGVDEIQLKRASVVEWCEHGFWIKDEFFGWEGEGLWEWDNLEVIGNIYENPELINK